MYRPDLTRLENCMRRAVRGDEITIGFLGGSITQGSLASREQNTYASEYLHGGRKLFQRRGSIM